MKDDIALQFSWYYEIRKQHSNIVRLLVFTRLNGIQTFDIWLTHSNTMLTHANRLKRHDARKKRYAFACIQTTMQTSNSDWYQIAQRITCSSNSFLLENYTLTILNYFAIKIKINDFLLERAVKIKHLCNGPMHPLQIGSPLKNRSLLSCCSKISFLEVRAKSHKFSLFVIAAANFKYVLHLFS